MGHLLINYFINPNYLSVYQPLSKAKNIDVLQNGCPKLTNLMEPMDVPFPKDITNIKVGDYIYMAPETFPSKTKVGQSSSNVRKASASELDETFQDRRYTSASDMYAFGK